MLKFILLSTLSLGISLQAQANQCIDLFAKTPSSNKALINDLEGSPLAGKTVPHHEAIANVLDLILNAPNNSTVRIYTDGLKRDGVSSLLLISMVMQTSLQRNVSFEVYLPSTANKRAVKYLSESSMIKVFQTEVSTLGNRTIVSRETNDSLEIVEFDANLTTLSLENVASFREALTQGNAPINNFSRTTVSSSEKNEMNKFFREIERNYPTQHRNSPSEGITTAEAANIDSYATRYATQLYQARFGKQIKNTDYLSIAEVLASDIK